MKALFRKSWNRPPGDALLDEERRIGSIQVVVVVARKMRIEKQSTRTWLGAGAAAKERDWGRWQCLGRGRVRLLLAIAGSLRVSCW